MLTVYGKEPCSYCTKAKLHLDSLEIKYDFKLLDKDYTREELLNIYPNAKTFPVIIDEDGTFIGGYDNLIVNEKYKK